MGASGSLQGGVGRFLCGTVFSLVTVEGLAISPAAARAGSASGIQNRRAPAYSDPAAPARERRQRELIVLIHAGALANPRHHCQLRGSGSQEPVDEVSRLPPYRKVKIRVISDCYLFVRVLT